MHSPFDGRPRIFRDPVHGDIEWPKTPFGELINNLIDTPDFQRLRHIRQNGVTNLVFHGAEHSRFAHSIGVAWTAAKMIRAVERNVGESISEEVREDTILAALLHDIGHGPFSHTLEEILGNFEHETMTVRFLTEEGNEIAQLLERSSSGRPQRLAQYIEKSADTKRRWWHDVVSSQLDADRLDYVQRDARMAGIDNHRPDIERLIRHISCHEDSLVVDHRAFDVIESLLLALDHLYGAVYFHRTVRAATVTVRAVLSRVAARSDTELPDGDPLRALLEQRNQITLCDYGRVTDATFWYHLDRWGRSEDEELSFHVDRLRRRRLPKHFDLPQQGVNKPKKLEAKARELVSARFPQFNPDLLVVLDEPSRVNYKRYSIDRDQDHKASILTGSATRPSRAPSKTSTKHAASCPKSPANSTVRACSSLPRFSTNCGSSPKPNVSCRSPP